MLMSTQYCLRENKRRYLARDDCSMLRIISGHQSCQMDREVVEYNDLAYSSEIWERTLTYQYLPDIVLHAVYLVSQYCWNYPCKS